MAARDAGESRPRLGVDATMTKAEASAAVIKAFERWELKERIVRGGAFIAKNPGDYKSAALLAKLERQRKGAGITETCQDLETAYHAANTAMKEVYDA